MAGRRAGPPPAGGAAGQRNAPPAGQSCRTGQAPGPAGVAPVARLRHRLPALAARAAADSSADRVPSAGLGLARAQGLAGSKGDPEAWERLGQITAPALLIGGGPDSHIPRDRLGSLPACRWRQRAAVPGLKNPDRPHQPGPAAARPLKVRFPSQRMIHHGPAGLMTRHLVSDARTGISARRRGLWQPRRQPQIFGRETPR
jgi:hypothetical protein